MVEVTAAQSPPMRVLVAEDDEGIRRILQMRLAKLGFEVEAVADGAQARAATDAAHFDVIVSDWMMPGGSGLELCAHARALPERPYVFFILVTARGGKESYLEGMRAGADDFLAKPIDKDQLEARMMAASRVVNVHRALAAEQAKLKHAYAELERSSLLDRLTGVGNRRAFDETIPHVQAEVDRYARLWSIALCDVDSFKAYNDTYGHPAGDEVLRRVGPCLQQHAREGDRVFRYGGEEFVILFPGQDSGHALQAMDRLRTAVQAMQIEHSGGPAGVVTLSAGVADLVSAEQRTSAATLEAADQALYAAKDDGRNRVCLAADAERPDVAKAC